MNDFYVAVIFHHRHRICADKSIITDPKPLSEKQDLSTLRPSDRRVYI